MSYEHCDEHNEDATNGCPKCALKKVASETGLEFQTSVDEGHEDVMCGLCQNEVKRGVTNKYTNNETGLCQTCIYRVFDVLGRVDPLWLTRIDFKWPE